MKNSAMAKMFKQRIFVFLIVVFLISDMYRLLYTFYFSSDSHHTKTISYKAPLPDKQRLSMKSRLEDLLQSSYLLCL